MKKLICLILAAVMTAGLLCACNHRDTEEDTGPNLIFSTEPSETAEAFTEPTEQTTVPATSLEETVKITLPTIAPTEETKPDNSSDRKNGETDSKKSDETGDQDQKDGKADTPKSKKTDDKETGGTHVHSYRSAVTVPTCTDVGYTTYTCKTCGSSYQANKKAALGHSFRRAETAPTCTEKGYTTYTCTVCAYKSYENIPAAGHSWSKWIVTAPATESAEGEEARTCSICRKTETREIDRLPSAHTHKYTAAVTVPTCTEKGYTTYTCTCGDSYKDKETAAKGHTWGEWAVTKEPTPEMSGVETRTCSVCGAAEDREVVHDHDYKDEAVTPTCTEKGYTIRTCKTCGISYKTNETNALGHSMETKETKPATCQDNGEKLHICKACGFSFTEPISATGNHCYESKETKTPACKDTGVMTYTCKVCGNSYTQSIPAAGHKWGEWKVTTPATEESEGVETRSCSVCGQTETRKLDRLSHTHKYESKVVAPTCTEKGYTLHTCPCGDSYKDKEIPAAGHKWNEWKVTTPAAEESEGEQTRTCSACGRTENQAIPKLEHVHKYDITAVIPATCTKVGENTYTCPCGTSYTEEIPLAEHTWDEWTRTAEPTQEAEGEETRTCSVCGAAETRPVEKLPGDPEPDVSSSYCVPEIIDIINVYREAEGLGTLSYDSANEDFANIRAAEICISFSHDRLDGTSVLYSSMRLGLYAENIAMTWGDYQHVVDLWMDSKGHRENMMESSYTKAVAARNGNNYVLLLG